MKNTKFVLGSAVLGFLVGLGLNLEVLAFRSVFWVPPPGFVPGALGTAGLSAAATAFFVFVNHFSWNLRIRLDVFGLPYALCAGIVPAYAFGSFLAGLAAVVFDGIVVLVCAWWQGRARAQNPA